MGQEFRDTVDHVGPRLAVVADARLEKLEDPTARVVETRAVARKKSLEELTGLLLVHLRALELGVDTLKLAGIDIRKTDELVSLLDLLAIVLGVADGHHRLRLAKGAGQRVHADDARRDKTDGDRLGAVVAEEDQEVLLHRVGLAGQEVLLLERGEEPDDLAVAQTSSGLVAGILADDRVEDIKTLVVLDGGIDLPDHAERVARVIANGREEVLERLAAGDLQGLFVNLPIELGLDEGVLGSEETLDDGPE